MPVFDLFSKRKKRQESQGKADVYKYDEIPEGLRIQVVHIWKTALGRWFRDFQYGLADPSPSSALWELIRDILTREKPLISLGNPARNPQDQCVE